ncbi:MAG: hypothetical protein KME03_12065 [Aphanocapsa lilacina HA4352-LM1]|nr:hypothetical protein [Aphanocapsa lilacina HA4352-LM1]
MSPMRRLVSYARNYARMVRKVLKMASDVRRQPSNSFTAAGFEVLPGFLERETCQDIVNFANGYLQGHSYVVSPQHYRDEEVDGGKCYVHHRAEVRDINLGMVQFINVQKLDRRFSQLLATVQKMLEERTGESLQAQSAVIQLDMPDGETKRRLHTDGLTIRYKAFIYLSDVNGSEDGPYTVIPGSHRHVLRKIMNLFYVRWRTLTWSKEKVKRSDQFGDMAIFYNERRSTQVLGSAGTMTLSNQLIVHQGGYNRKPRWAIVLHFIPRQYWDGKPFNMYQQEVESSSFPSESLNKAQMLTD